MTSGSQDPKIPKIPNEYQSDERNTLPKLTDMVHEIQ